MMRHPFEHVRREEDYSISGIGRSSHCAGCGARNHRRVKVKRQRPPRKKVRASFRQTEPRRLRARQGRSQSTIPSPTSRRHDETPCGQQERDDEPDNETRHAFGFTRSFVGHPNSRGIDSATCTRPAWLLPSIARDATVRGAYLAEPAASFKCVSDTGYIRYRVGGPPPPRRCDSRITFKPCRTDGARCRRSGGRAMK